MTPSDRTDLHLVATFTESDPSDRESSQIEREARDLQGAAERRAMLAAIAAALPQLEDDALACVAQQCTRLLRGQAQYGRVDVATDSRDWIREATEEVADMAVYLHLRLQQLGAR
jgi:hypothetical protein